jgi:toxin ParE1/3/4
VTGKPVIRRAQVDLDVLEVVEQYFTEGAEEAALRFVDELERACRAIGRHPAAGSPRYGHELDLPGLRSRKVGRFPYLVFYLELPDHVDVWRILHEQRDIPAWMHAPE